MKTRATLLVFPGIAASFGGAETVSYNSRFAYVKLPGVDKAIRLARSTLPDPERWNAFGLADAAQGRGYPQYALQRN